MTAGNGEYTLAGAVYGVYQGGSLVAQFTTDESGHGQTSEKLPNGDYVVREISAPAGYALSQEEFHVTVAGGNVHVNAQDAPRHGESHAHSNERRRNLAGPSHREPHLSTARSTRPPTFTAANT